MQIREKYCLEIELAQTARFSGNCDKEWYHLERAHVLGQFQPWRHLRVHLLMIQFSVVHFRINEFIGQIPRIILAIPGSITRLAPRWNTGGSNVGIFEPMEIPEDFKIYY